LHNGVKIKNLGEIMPAELGSRLKGLPMMYQRYDAALKEICTKLEILDSDFEVTASHNPIHHMASRLKSPKSIRDKMIKYGLEITDENVRDHILDIAGVRVVCNYIDDIYYISGRLCEQSDITVVSVKDYIREPKPSGYRSLHIIVKVPVFLSTKVENIPVEIQFRTVSMDVWASLEHELRYKSKSVLSEDLQLQLKENAVRLAEVDRVFQDISDSIGPEKNESGNKESNP